MTLIQMSDCVYKNSKGHVLNGKETTKENFRYWFEKMFCDQKKVLFSMSFPDGEWHCVAVHYRDGYDYYVPDTRKEEAIMLERFLKEKYGEIQSNDD